MLARAITYTLLASTLGSSLSGWPEAAADDAATVQGEPRQTAHSPSPGVVERVSYGIGGPVTLDDSFDEFLAAPRFSNTSCPQLWARADYLQWWTRGVDAPPLATTSPPAPANQAGVLGQPGTSVLFGRGLVDGDRSGARFTVGLWLDDCRQRGIDVTYLTLDQETDSFTASQNEFPVLARPFFNAQISGQDARQVALPGQTQGTLNISTTTDFQTLEALYRSVSDCAPCRRVEFTFGYRFAELDEQLRFAESTLALAGGAAGAMINLTEQFDVDNQFHGGQLGITLDGVWAACYCWEIVAKVAVGNTNSRARVTGQTTTTSAGATNTVPGGLLTQPTNLGVSEQDEFSAIWELGLNLRRELQCGLTARLGYTFLVWQDVSRAGQQVDFTVNPSQIPPGVLAGEPRPGFAFQITDFWAHGLHLGLEYAY